MKSVFITSLFALILTGCALPSTHQKFYQSIQNPNDAKFVRLPPKQEAKIYRVENLESEIQVYLSKNYVVVGQSSFNGEYEEERRIQTFAQENGISVVLVKAKHTETTTSTVPILMPNTTTEYQSGNVYGAGGIGTYSGTSTSYGTTVIPYTVTQRRYDQTAVYLMPLREKPRLGVHYRNLTPSERRQQQTNTGVLVSAVIENTPAFHANLFSGDVIIGWNGRKLNSEEDLKGELSKISTGTHRVEMMILRNGVEKKAVLELN